MVVSVDFIGTTTTGRLMTVSNVWVVKGRAPNRGADNPPPRGFSKVNMDGCICDISDGVHTVFRGPSKCVSKVLGV